MSVPASPRARRGDVPPTGRRPAMALIAALAFGPLASLRAAAQAPGVPASPPPPPSPATPPPASPPALVRHDIVLLQPGDVMRRRVDDGALAAWLTALQDALAGALEGLGRQWPTAGFVALAVRPGRRLHAWYDFRPALPPATEAALTRAMQSLPVVEVTGGPIVLALRVSVWRTQPPDRHAPAPAEWRAAAQRAGHPLPLEALIDEVWPDEAATASPGPAAASGPTGR